MGLIKGGTGPATKDDLRELQITMLAGFQLCMEKLHAIMALAGNRDLSLTKGEVEQLILQQRAHFEDQMKIAARQILETEKPE